MKIKYLALALLTGFASVEAAAQSPLPRKDIPAIAKAANGAIVTIITAANDKPIAQGTGFLVGADGVIVTNYHVIETGNVAVVKFPDDTAFPVDGVLASDKVRDLAIIKIHGKTFRTLALGDSDDIQVGEEVVAIGNPLLLESTVSNGIISGVRTSKELGKFLQTTAPISPGSSGGPLFNMRGEVVGINTLYLEGGENLNFAIPVNDAKNLLSTKSARLHNLPNEQPSENASSAEGNENSNDLKKQLEQIEWMQATRGHRNEKSDELRETLQWMQDTLPEGSSECIRYNKSTDSTCFRTELRKFWGCKVEFNLVLTIWIDGRAMPESYHPSFNYYLDLGNLDPERILSKNVHDDSHEYGQFSLHTWNDTNKIFHVEVPTNELHNELTFHLKADYSLRLEKAFRHAVDLCGGKPSTVKF